MPEVIALSVRIPFVVPYMRMKIALKWDFLWASLCLAAAVYFVFSAQ